MSVRHSLGYFRSLAVSLTVAFAMFAGTTLIHAQEMDLNEFESLIGTGQTLSAISSEQALDIATGDDEFDLELLSGYFASNGRDAEGVAKMVADMIRELGGDPEVLADASERIADAATDALNAQYITRFEEDEDFSLPEGAIGFDFATPDSKQIFGDAVNVASRLEGQMRTYGTTIVFGNETRQQVPQYASLELDLIQVKGRTEPERIFALLGRENMAESVDFITHKQNHDAFLAAYRAQDWDKAREFISTCRQSDKYGLDTLYNVYEARNNVYEARIAEFSNKPAIHDWDGVFVALDK